MFVFCNFRGGDRHKRGVPGVSFWGTGCTAAETGEGGSVDNARSMILLTAPAWARASFFINLENGGILDY
jgi:hypothetical protein